MVHDFQEHLDMRLYLTSCRENTTVDTTNPKKRIWKTLLASVRKKPSRPVVDTKPGRPIFTQCWIWEVLLSLSLSLYEVAKPQPSTG